MLGSRGHIAFFGELEKLTTGVLPTWKRRFIVLRADSGSILAFKTQGDAETSVARCEEASVGGVSIDALRRLELSEGVGPASGRLLGIVTPSLPSKEFSRQPASSLRSSSHTVACDAALDSVIAGSRGTADGPGADDAKGASDGESPSSGTLHVEMVTIHGRTALKLSGTSVVGAPKGRYLRYDAGSTVFFPPSLTFRAFFFTKSVHRSFHLSSHPLYFLATSNSGPVDQLRSLRSSIETMQAIRLNSQLGSDVVSDGLEAAERGPSDGTERGGTKVEIDRDAREGDESDRYGALPPEIELLEPCVSLPVSVISLIWSVFISRIMFPAHAKISFFASKPKR